MTIPGYQSMMLPLLRLASDGQEHAAREAFETLADEFSLTDEELRELLPSGQQTTFENRVGWKVLISGDDVRNANEGTPPSQART